MSIFTHKERTVKSKTVAQAVEEAKVILKNTQGINKICINAVRENKYQMQDAITISEMSALVDELVCDTVYYECY